MNRVLGLLAIAVWITVCVVAVGVSMAGIDDVTSGWTP